jgi:molecular chaperone DnaK
VLIDVTPLSLGVETAGGFCDVVIPANSPVPCDRSRVFRTASDGQSSVLVKVCQGESSRFEDNTELGDLRLTDFRKAPRGEVDITVTFEIDADGILNVRAHEGATGRSATARIELLGAQMDPERFQAMMQRQAQRPVL